MIPCKTCGARILFRVQADFEPEELSEGAEVEMIEFGNRCLAGSRLVCCHDESHDHGHIIIGSSVVEAESDPAATAGPDYIRLEYDPMLDDDGKILNETGAALQQLQSALARAQERGDNEAVAVYQAVASEVSQAHRRIVALLRGRESGVAT